MNLYASERKALDNFIHSSAFLTLKSEMLEIDEEINDILDPYIEILECRYKNKEYLSVKHNGLMSCIFEQSLAYLLDSQNLNHKIMFKYYGKAKNEVRIGYIEIQPFIRLSNRWWPPSIYRDIKEQILQMSVRLKFVESIKIDIPTQLGNYEADELIILYQQMNSDPEKTAYEVLFYNNGIFKLRSWADAMYDSKRLEINYKSNYGIWDKI